MTSHNHTCSRRAFLLGTATTFAGALLVACGSSGTKTAANDVPVGSAIMYSTVCPHQGSPITQVSGDTVKCTRHGSVFSIKDGSVISGPSQAGLSPKEFSKDGDSIVVK